MKLKILILLSTLLIIISSCNNQIKENEEKNISRNNKFDNQIEAYRKLHADRNNTEVFALNDKAVKLMEQSLRYEKSSLVRDSLLNEALTYTTKAIDKKEDFYYGYLNKAIILKEMEKYDAAIKSLEKLLQVKEDYPEAIFIMGQIYEKKGNLEVSKELYLKALEAYDEYIETPMASTQDIINRERVLLFIVGKEKYLKRINEQISNNPDSSDLLINKQIIERFDREEYFKKY